MIRALVFDFDGLILETEGPIYQSWQELYREHNGEITLEDWAKIVGSSNSAFDPQHNLEKLIGRPLAEDAISARLQRETDLIASQVILPGVEEMLQAARRQGLKLGVASSSPREWVFEHLERLGLLEYFQSIKTSEDVRQVKPDPELYLAVLEELGVQPHEAVAFEDSPNGMLAAKRAGMACVLVPNELTRQLPRSGADLELETLAGHSLDELLRKIETQ